MYKPLWTWFTTATDLRYVRIKVSEWLFLSWLAKLTVWYMSCRETTWCTATHKTVRPHEPWYVPTVRITVPRLGESAHFKNYQYHESILRARHSGQHRTFSCCRQITSPFPSPPPMRTTPSAFPYYHSSQTSTTPNSKLLPHSPVPISPALA